MTIEGRLTIDLVKKGDRIESAKIGSSRPLQIAKLFRGKTADETLDVIPRIFSLCANAQSCAASNACGRAFGKDPDTHIIAGRKLIVLAENAREHLLRIGLDWAKKVDPSSPPTKMSEIVSLPNKMQNSVFENGAGFAISSVVRLDRPKVNEVISQLDTYLEEHVFGEEASHWLGREDFCHLRDWSSSSKTPAASLLNHVVDQSWQGVGIAGVDFLPPINAGAMKPHFMNEYFTSSPTWEGTARETSSLSRQADMPLVQNLTKDFGAGILTRLAARLVELAQVPQDMRDTLATLETEETAPQSQSGEERAGYGFAAVETARGRLVHALTTDNGLIEDYWIIAPTEWNFHAAGPAKKALEDLRADDRSTLETQANLLITAIDPCVGYELRIH